MNITIASSSQDELAKSIVFLIPLCKVPEAFTDADLRSEAVVSLEGFAVGIGGRHISGLHSYKLVWPSKS